MNLVVSNVGKNLEWSNQNVERCMMKYTHNFDVCLWILPTRSGLCLWANGTWQANGKKMGNGGLIRGWYGTWGFLAHYQCIQPIAATV